MKSCAKTHTFWARWLWDCFFLTWSVFNVFFFFYKAIPVPALVQRRLLKKLHKHFLYGAHQCLRQWFKLQSTDQYISACLPMIGKKIRTRCCFAWISQVVILSLYWGYWCKLGNAVLHWFTRPQFFNGVGTVVQWLINVWDGFVGIL